VVQFYDPVVKCSVCGDYGHSKTSCHYTRTMDLSNMSHEDVVFWSFVHPLDRPAALREEDSEVLEGTPDTGEVEYVAGDILEEVEEELMEDNMEETSDGCLEDETDAGSNEESDNEMEDEEGAAMEEGEDADSDGVLEGLLDYSEEESETDIGEESESESDTDEEFVAGPQSEIDQEL
jgi:hypothetical protein